MNFQLHLIGMISAGFSVHLTAVEPLFENEIPNAFSLNLQELPSITLKGPDGNVTSVRQPALIQEIEIALSLNDLPGLSRMLVSDNVEMQRQAAIAIGKLTKHQSEARELLANFIATNSNAFRTEFGEQLLARRNAIAAAQQSLASLSPSATPAKSASPAAPSPRPEAESLARRPWWLAGGALVMIVLVWMALKKRF